MSSKSWTSSGRIAAAAGRFEGSVPVSFFHHLYRRCNIVVRFAPFRPPRRASRPAGGRRPLRSLARVRLRSGDRASGSVATAWVKKMALDEVPTAAHPARLDVVLIRAISASRWDRASFGMTSSSSSMEAMGAHQAKPGRQAQQSCFVQRDVRIAVSTCGGGGGQPPGSPPRGGGPSSFIHELESCPAVRGASELSPRAGNRPSSGARSRSRARCCSASPP